MEPLNDVAILRNLEGIPVNAKSHEAEDLIGVPAAAPTVIVGATGLTFVMGTVGVKNILLAPEKVNTVVRVSRRIDLHTVYLRRSLSHGEDRRLRVSEAEAGGKVGGWGESTTRR